MDIISSQFFVADNKLYNSNDINWQYNTSDYQTYEVMRCTDRVLIFMMDHIERMSDGINKLQKNTRFNNDSAINNLYLLIQHIEDFAGNIKLLGRIDKQNVHFAAYGIPHQYPQIKMYKEGILINTIPIERPDPLIKQVHIANSISQKIESRKATGKYESLLVNHENCITEGSKSNFFLIRDNCLFSAPEQKILHGITRKYVLRIAMQKNIPILYQNINKKDLKNYEAAFICGTSPKVLPVKQINQIQYNPHHPIIKILIDSYNKIIEEYIHQQKSLLNS